MSAQRYSDLRKFGRDILDIESQAWKVKRGLMSRVGGASIISDRICGDKVTFLGIGEKGWAKFIIEVI